MGGPGAQAQDDTWNSGGDGGGASPRIFYFYSYIQFADSSLDG
jgi:hypothetical protein